MKTRSITLLVLILTFFLVSCEKDGNKEKSIEPYFSNGYIKFTLIGEFNGSDINFSNLHSIYSSYEGSILNKTSDNYKTIVVSRSSNDLQNFITLQITLDSTNNYSESSFNGVSFHFTIKNSDNTYLELRSRAEPVFFNNPSEFTDLYFNEAQKTIQGKFNYTDGDIKITGAFQAKLNEIVK